MIGDRLRKLRLENNKTQEDVAKFLGITRPAYTQYETNKRNPDPETMGRLADFFGTTTDYLITGTSLGSVIKQKRIEHGYTYEQIHNWTGVTPEEFSKQENSSKITLDHHDIKLIAQIFDLTPHKLFEEAGYIWIDSVEDWEPSEEDLRRSDEVFTQTTPSIAFIHGGQDLTEDEIEHLEEELKRYRELKAKFLKEKEKKDK